MKIAYCFADHAVEAEALASLGDVHRFTIDPKPSPFVDETTQINLMTETPDAEGFDLWVGHPQCAKFCDMPGVDPADHENQIPRARELAEAMADHYVIENKPRAPLEDPVHLTGKMFGLPIEYERAFETSFAVQHPPRQQTLTTQTSSFFYSERTHKWWKTVKGIRGSYPKEHVAKNALPLAYVDWLTRQYLEATGGAQGVSDYSDYDAEMDEQRAREANHTLEEAATTEK